MNTATRRWLWVGIAVLVIGLLLWYSTHTPQTPSSVPTTREESTTTPALAALATLQIKPKKQFETCDRQTLFGGWSQQGGCSSRERTLQRDMTGVKVGDKCQVTAGRLDDAYTGTPQACTDAACVARAIQIDHIVALCNAYATGADAWTYAKRRAFANDPNNLWAVASSANTAKGARDFAEWRPVPGVRDETICRYALRQVAIKAQYRLWVTQAEHDALHAQLSKCPAEPLPVW